MLESLAKMFSREELNKLKTRWNYFILSLFVAIAVIPLVWPHPMVIHVIIITLVYAVAGQSWNLLAGYTGQFSFGQALFFGAGGYAVSWFFVVLGENIWIGMLAGFAASILIALLISLMAFRLRAVYFSMVTLALGTVAVPLVGFFTAFRSGTGSWTGGWYGIMLPYIITSQQILYITLAVFMGTVLLTIAITKSRLGHFMIAVRDDEDLANSIGINTYKVKTMVSVATAVPTSIAGIIFALYIRFVDPYLMFGWANSWNAMIGSMIGGIGTIWGPLLGSLFLFPLTTLLQSFLGGNFSGLPSILTGLAIFAVIAIIPGGFIDFIKKAIGTSKPDDEEASTEDEQEETPTEEAQT